MYLREFLATLPTMSDPVRNGLAGSLIRFGADPSHVERLCSGVLDSSEQAQALDAQRSDGTGMSQGSPDYHWSCRGDYYRSRSEKFLGEIGVTEPTASALWKLYSIVGETIPSLACLLNRGKSQGLRKLERATVPVAIRERVALTEPIGPGRIAQLALLLQETMGSVSLGAVFDVYCEDEGRAALAFFVEAFSQVSGMPFRLPRVEEVRALHWMEASWRKNKHSLPTKDSTSFECVQGEDGVNVVFLKGRNEVRYPTVPELRGAIVTFRMALPLPRLSVPDIYTSPLDKQLKMSCCL